MHKKYFFNNFNSNLLILPWNCFSTYFRYFLISHIVHFWFVTENKKVLFFNFYSKFAVFFQWMFMRKKVPSVLSFFFVQNFFSRFIPSFRNFSNAFSIFNWYPHWNFWYQKSFQHYLNQIFRTKVKTGIPEFYKI